MPVVTNVRPPKNPPPPPRPLPRWQRRIEVTRADASTSAARVKTTFITLPREPWDGEGR